MSGGADLSKLFPVIVDEKSGAMLWKDLRTLTLQYMIPVGRLRRFYEGIANGVLYGTRCPKCGARYFPPKPECSRCGSSDMEWVEVGREGRLLAHAVVNIKPESYQQYEDYVVGIAEMDNGFKVLAWIKCDDPKKLKRGMRVRLETARMKGSDLLFYQLVPTGE
jgi:uncharacterized OB-fold protein